MRKMGVAFVAVALAAGCGGDTKAPGLILHALEQRRGVCADIAGAVGGAWRSAIDSGIGPDTMIAMTLGDASNRNRAARANIYGLQVQRLLTSDGDRMASELKAAVLDASAEVEALCSMARNPAGLSYLSFGTKVADSRTNLDRSSSKLRALAPTPADFLETFKMDEEAKAAGSGIR